MDQNFMKERPVFPLLMSMALPMVISMMVNSLYNIVDSYFVAKISEDAMTALSYVYPLQNFVNAVAIGFGVGINAVIAIYLGAKDNERADRAASWGMLLAIVQGIVMTVVCIAVIPSFLRAFNASGNILDLGCRYADIVFGFSIIISVDLAFEKVFQSVGRMMVTMAGLMGGCIVNIALDPLLIFGMGPFPRLGIEGAALATGIGQIFTLVIYFIVYFGRPINVKFGIKHLREGRLMVKKLYAIGIPAILNMALPSLLTSALNAILSMYSATYVMILGVYYKLQTFLYMPANGIIQGMRPVIGYNYGAGEHARVRKIFTITLALNAGIMLAGTVVCLLVPGSLIGMFTENAATITAGKTALRIICAGFVVSAVSVTASGALEGLGKGTPSLIISLLRYVVVIIPAAWVLARACGFGPAGVWNAFWVAEVVTAVCSVLIYRRATGE